MVGTLKERSLGRNIVLQRLHDPHRVDPGVMPMSVYEALMFAVTFAALVVAILSFNHKNNQSLS